MRRFLVPGIPFALSLSLSLSTVGSSVSWQDSGFFLSAVKEMGVLYPHGFVLYLILGKFWTFALGFLDFTLALHLFSALCAASAAGVLSLAARDLLRAQGPLFRLGLGENDLASAAAGCLAAAGYTFWSAALLAKSYALLYLILALLIWRMIRADESGKARDFTIVAALIGLAWAAHPSASTLGLALLLFVAAHRKELGWKGIAFRAAVAGLAALVPSLLLPVLASRDPALMLGHPASAAGVLRYLLGGSFTHRSGTFGFEPWRAIHAVKYLWEEFLGIGLVLALVGLSRLAVVNRRLLLGIAAWTVPSAAVAILFRIEGQLDFWLVSAWLPLHLAVAVGFASIPGRLAKAAVPALGAAALVWAVAANGSPVSQRGDTLAEEFGRLHLKSLEPGAILLLESDDALSTTHYLQSVRGFRRDIRVVNAALLGVEWYDLYLIRQDGRLKRGAAPGARAWAEANVARTRPVYFEAAPGDPAGLVPRGPLLRMAPPGEPNEPEVWEFPVRIGDLRTGARRERGIRLTAIPGGFDVEPEAYEHRWIAAFARAGDQQARAAFKKGQYARAAELFESARDADTGRAAPESVQLLGMSYFLQGRYDRAEPVLKEALHLALSPRQAVRSCSCLSTICRKQGRTLEAERWQNQAMGVVGSDPELRREFEQYPKPP